MSCTDLFFEFMEEGLKKDYPELLEQADARARNFEKERMPFFISQETAQNVNDDDDDAWIVASPTPSKKN